MKNEIMKNLIDKYLNNLVIGQLNMVCGKIQIDMSVPNQDENEEWQYWLPIESRVSDEEIENFEIQINYRLPSDFKVFLKHKHFYELYISIACFFSHPVNVWVNSQKEKMFGYPSEFLTDKGFLPFADWSDWGLLCFDTNRNNIDNNYPIVLWDHDSPDEIQNFAESFYDLIIKLDEDENKNRH